MSPDNPSRFAAEDTVVALEWTGVILAPVSLFGCQFAPVVTLDPVVHRDRVRSDQGPQLDEDILAMWAWPQSPAPHSPVHLVGALFVIGRSWRRGLRQAQRWSAFSPTALIDRTGTASSDPWCRWECELAGVGLVETTGDEPRLVVPDAHQPPRPDHVTADRWVQECLYDAALRTGALPPDAHR